MDPNKSATGPIDQFISTSTVVANFAAAGSITATVNCGLSAPPDIIQIQAFYIPPRAADVYTTAPLIDTINGINDVEAALGVSMVAIRSNDLIPGSPTIALCNMVNTKNPMYEFSNLTRKDFKNCSFDLQTLLLSSDGGAALASLGACTIVLTIKFIRHRVGIEKT